MMTRSQRLLATGWSLHLPGVRPATALAARFGAPAGAWAHEESVAPENAAALLGRKGLLAAEPATRLALCAVHKALRLPAGGRRGEPVCPRTAVVACGNLVNVGAVSRVARTIATEGGRAVSVLDAPNVSGNVVASSVALRFGFGGPSLMVCSGARAGGDGLRLAGLLLGAGRAERVVLVGAEPADEVATAIYGPGRTALHAGAACVVLEAWRPRRYGGRRCVQVRTGRWMRAPRVVIGPGGFDPAAHWGDCYGAQGVVALALAAHLAADEGHDVAGVRADDQSTLVTSAPALRTILPQITSGDHRGTHLFSS